MKKIFLSYALNGKESDYVQLLKDELESHGVQIYDANYLRMNCNNTSALYDSLNTCDNLIAFMIENYPNVFYDVGYAMSKDKKVLIIRSDYIDTSFDFEMAPTILLRDYFETSGDILNFTDNC